MVSKVHRPDPIVNRCEFRRLLLLLRIRSFGIEPARFRFWDRRHRGIPCRRRRHGPLGQRQRCGPRFGRLLRRRLRHRRTCHCRVGRCRGRRRRRPGCVIAQRIHAVLRIQLRRFFIVLKRFAALPRGVQHLGQGMMRHRIVRIVFQCLTQLVDRPIRIAVEQINIGQHESSAAIVGIPHQQLREHRLASLDVAALPARSRRFELRIVPVAVEVVRHLFSPFLTQRSHIGRLIAGDGMPRFIQTRAPCGEQDCESERQPAPALADIRRLSDSPEIHHLASGESG